MAATDKPRSPDHPFYMALNKLLAEAKLREHGLHKLLGTIQYPGGKTA